MLCYCLCCCDVVQGNANNTAGIKQVDQRQSHGAGTYQKVFGPGKRRIRGLWKRNGAFYAQLKVQGDDGVKRARRTRLKDKDGQPVQTAAAAVKAMASLTTKRDEESLELAPKRTPFFRDCAKQYFSWLDTVKDAKSQRPSSSRRTL